MVKRQRFTAEHHSLPETVETELSFLRPRQMQTQPQRSKVLDSYKLTTSDLKD